MQVDIHRALLSASRKAHACSCCSSRRRRSSSPHEPKAASSSPAPSHLNNPLLPSNRSSLDRRCSHHTGTSSPLLSAPPTPTSLPAAQKFQPRLRRRSSTDLQIHPVHQQLRRFSSPPSPAPSTITAAAQSGVTYGVSNSLSQAFSCVLK